jgi:hypothetical protein
MNITLIVSTVAAAAGFAVAWNLQAHQITKQELNHAQERIEIQRAARVVADRASTAVIVAQNNAATRGAVLRRDADAARTAASGLRDDLDIASRAAATSLDACTVTATTFGRLLIASTEEYRKLAADCSVHVSDIRTLVEACQK